MWGKSGCKEDNEKHIWFFGVVLIIYNSNITSIIRHYAMNRYPMVFSNQFNLTSSSKTLNDERPFVNREFIYSIIFFNLQNVSNVFFYLTN